MNSLASGFPHFVLVLTAALVVGTGASAHAQAAEVAIDKAVAAWAKVRTASGTVEQTVTNALLGSSATSHATFQQERPNRLSVRFTDEKGDAIVSDGQWLWIYLPSASPGQVIRRAADDKANVPVDPGELLDSPRTRFDFTDKGTASVGDHTTRAVGLTPKKGSPEWFARATVWIDEADGSIRQFEVVENTGVTRRIRFLTLTTNTAIDPAAFRFVVPKGVKVVSGG